MSKVDKILMIINTIFLSLLVLMLFHIVADVIPMMSARATHLSIMTECSQRRLAAMKEIKAGVEKVLVNASEEEKQKIQQSLTDSYGTFNSSEFYQKCAETVKKDWSL